MHLVEIVEVERWWYVSGPRWTFAIHEWNGVVVEAAPISEWAIGKQLEPVLAWWRSKGADVIEELRLPTSEIGDNSHEG